MDEIIEEQGWNPETVLTLVLRFVEERGLTQDLTDHLQGVADEENGG